MAKKKPKNESIDPLDRNCRNCAFFDDVHIDCRRHPPRVIGGSDEIHGATMYPAVKAGDWCGEHRTKREYELWANPLLQADPKTGKVEQLTNGPGSSCL